jgi:hypothetical protein
MNSFVIIVLFMSMIFCHIVDDYYLQGCLANMKSKNWWEKNYPDKKYKNDFIIALFEHAFSWAFSIHIPILVYVFYKGISINTIIYILSMVFNIIIHMIVDNTKANLLKINLTQDQCIHFIQIVTTLILYVIYIRGYCL